MTEHQRPPQSPEVAEKLNITQRLLWRIIARMVRIIDEKYGEEGLNAIYKGIRDWEFWQVPVKKAGLTPGKASVEDALYKVLEAGDEVLFTMKERPLVQKTGEDQYLYKVRHCNVADVISRESWKTCPYVARAIEEGAAKAANPNIKLTGDQFLVNGADGCYTYYAMESPEAKR
ncbi:MAG: hypothetical protein NTU41_08475 [Chloroflexi bacterium]|nr:hypothetical protein [Chloroflexota bacterium]